MNMNFYREVEEIPVVLDAIILQKVLKISRATTYNLLNSAEFPTLTIGKRKLVTKTAFLKWLNDNTKN